MQVWRFPHVHIKVQEENIWATRKREKNADIQRERGWGWQVINQKHSRNQQNRRESRQARKKETETKTVCSPLPPPIVHSAVSSRSTHQGWRPQCAWGAVRGCNDTFSGVRLVSNDRLQREERLSEPFKTGISSWAAQPDLWHPAPSLSTTTCN